MDLNCFNIVVNDDNEAVLININEIGGISWGLRASEMKIEDQSFIHFLLNQQLNDIYAFDVMLWEIAIDEELNEVMSSIILFQVRAFQNHIPHLCDNVFYQTQQLVLHCWIFWQFSQSCEMSKNF